ncbi:MAG: choice-of-anchor J domain-containing protein, partial [Bacteroidales bacterium]|nr:choice-of-anchor J domain-containing protein [Bacteroidales bacterium]
MKKLLTTFLLFAGIFSASAAVTLRENFESGSLPSGWKVYSNVGATQTWRVDQAINNGSNGNPKAINPYEWSSGTHYLAGIPYMAAGKTYNEWLVSPELTIPNSQNRNIITFYSHHQDLNNNMTLRVFEGTDTAHAVVVWKANAVNKWDSLIEVNVSRFNGKTIHFAWVLQRQALSNFDNSAWGIDVITVETVINGVDLQPVEFTSPLEHEDVNMYKKGVNIPVSLRIVNNGRSDASQASISYTFAGNTVTETLPAIKAKEEVVYTFQAPINVPNAGSNTISVTVNASGDEVSNNNTLSISSFWTSGESSLDFNFESSAALAAGRWGDEGWVVYQEDNATGYRIPTQSMLFSNGCWAVGQAGGTLASIIWGRMAAFTCSDFPSSEIYIGADRWMVLPKIHISSSPTY